MTRRTADTLSIAAIVLLAVALLAIGGTAWAPGVTS